MGVNPADLAGLTVDEKLDPISELWDSIESSKAVPPLTEAQGLSNPGSMIDWTIIRQELRKK